MAGNLEVSFNSPQCGWMSIGFYDGVNEFHTTTAHEPYKGALGDLMRILTEIRSASDSTERTLKWNRDPEEFDFRFSSENGTASVQIYEYPTDEREEAEKKLVFSHTAAIESVTSAFAKTFKQLYADRETDEFEFNWREPFPFDEYERFRSATA